MILFRSVRISDVDAIHHVAQHSGIGMTTLPKDKHLLKSRIEWSCDSFKKSESRPDKEYYFFVVEDLISNKIVGTSAIEARIGYGAPFYSYKVSKRTRVCHSLNIRSEYEVLNLVNDNEGRSELCTLFLEPQYRKNNNGLLLSKARFLFMAQNSARFSSIVIADMRGVSDEQGNSPFWDNLGTHFFHMPFEEADRLTLATNKQFIADLMPRNPVYVKLLSPEAQAVIGKPNKSTVPAMNILLKEGFRFNNYIDIFDAGPTIEAPLSEIRTISLSRIVTIQSLSDEVSGSDYLLSNTQLDFRATIDFALLNTKDNTCIISKETAKLLEVQCGDSLRIAPVHLHESPH